MNNIFKKSFILSSKNNYKVNKKTEDKIKQILENLDENKQKSKTTNINDPKSNENKLNQEKITNNNKSNFNSLSQNTKHKISKYGKISDKIKSNQFSHSNNYKFNKELKFETKNINFKSKYEKIVCYYNDNGVKKAIIHDAAKGFGVQPELIKTTPCDGLNVTIGILRGSEKLIKNCIAQKKDFLYIDHAYFMRGHDKGRQSHYRTILNNLHVNFIDENATDERLRLFNIKPKKWKRDGSLILICPPTDAIINFYEEQNWLDNIMRDLRKYTDRPFKIKFKKTVEFKKKYKTNETILKQVNKFWREKYGKFVCDDDIKKDFNNAWCLITFSSTVALEAILNGIPVICGKECCCYPVAQHSLDQIENLIYPDTYKWLCTLANHQFSREEMASGYAWKFLGL